MGYIDKTVSKNETLVKQAKISKLSFLDRYLTAVLFVLGGLFALANMLFLKLEPFDLGEVSLPISSVAVAGAGLVLIALFVLLAIYRLVQAIGRVEKDAVLPGAVFARLFLFGLVGVAIGLVSYLIFEEGMMCDLINAIGGVVFGALVLVFTILKYKSIKLVVTDKRVCGRINIWYTRSFDLPIDKADNVEIKFSFWGKMFNYATIVIKSVMGEYKVKYVKSAEEFKNLIIDFAGEGENLYF